MVAQNKYGGNYCLCMWKGDTCLYYKHNFLTLFTEKNQITENCMYRKNTHHNLTFYELEYNSAKIHEICMTLKRKTIMTKVVNYKSLLNQQVYQDVNFVEV